MAAALSLLISSAVASLAALLVFGLWYPADFRLMAGGKSLFILVATVDVILGPLLTLVIFDVSKTRRQLRRDLTTIVVLQMAALLYGLHTVYVARPVAMVFEVDRLRLVTAKDVQMEELPKARPEFRTLPLTGPWLLGTRATTSVAEHNDALFMGLVGTDISSRPQFWQPYELSKDKALAKSKSLDILIAHYPDQATDLGRRLSNLGVDANTGRFVPAMARGEWCGVLDASGNVLGYLPVDCFF